MDGARKQQASGKQRRVFEFVRKYLPADEPAQVAAVVFRGPGPGLLGFLQDYLAQALTWFWTYRRRYFTIVLTTRRVLLFENVSESEPDRQVAEWPVDEFALTVNKKSFSTEIGGVRYWYWPDSEPQLRAITEGTASR